MSELTYLEAIRDGIREVMKEDKTAVSYTHLGRHT